MQAPQWKNGSALVAANELKAGNINHAIFLGIVCAAGHTHVFPAVQDEDARCTGRGPHTPIGSRVWLDLPDSRIDALPILDWEKTLLRAMHQYGGYIMDTGCHATNCPAYADSIMNFMLAQEVDLQYVAFGAPSPWVKYASTHGWNELLVRPRDGRYKAATRWVSRTIGIRLAQSADGTPATFTFSILATPTTHADITGAGNAMTAEV
ncbi:MAG: hypothetical protein JWN27_3142 [Candidatus Eremiobacteraeota bacterium]|nr:hypothetical protein [Candidatus Eremiobacteraeota bacterium]